MGAAQQLLAAGSADPASLPHRYWRIVTVETVSAGAFFEPSEIQVLTDGVDVTASATKTSAPVGGGSDPLSNLFDGNLNTRCYWPRTGTPGSNYIDSDWFMQFEFASDTKINGIKQGQFDDSNRVLSQFTLQFSDNGTSWSTLGSKTGLTAPGNFTLSSLYSFP